MDVASILGGSEQSVLPSSSNGVDALSSDDFFKLLITQLTNQDPLQPTGNDELLKQISSIREIELSSTLTESLQHLAGQQNFASASGLIGQYVTGVDPVSGAVKNGVVSAVRFTEDGNAVLHFSSGEELPLANLSTVQAPLSAAQGLVGKQVIGIQEGSQSELVQGLVTSVSSNSDGNPRLELDTGEAVNLRDVLEIGEGV